MILACFTARGQVDTSYVYNTSTPFGTLDIRLAKSATRYYYLQENITFSYRESSPGVRTNTYRDMTSWDSSPYSQGNMREKNGSKDYFIMNYRLLFPQSYNASYSEGYPLIVMMHGAGERANCWDANCYWATKSYNPNNNSPVAPTTSNHQLLNNDHNLAHGGQPHLTARNLAAGKLPDDPTLHPRAFPGFVLFAQNLNGWNVTAVQDLIRLVRLAVKKYNINPDQIYIHGLSNGGSAVYEAIKRAPWLFSGALPMSAIGDAGITSKNLYSRVAHIPVWTFQGGRDTSPTPGKTQGYVTKFRNAGMEVRYSLYPNLGHGTWNTAYAEPDFFTWMLSKSKSKLHVYFDVPVICGTTGQGVRMGFSPGFHAYQWQRNGSNIPGATSNEYVATTAGEYRARFSRKANPGPDDWNEWSQVVTVTHNSPAKPTIAVTGTQFMRGPDNKSAYNVVYLSSTPGDKYFWYKNGALVNIPNTSLDDTTRVYRLSSGSTGSNGAFTVQTRGNDNCPSPVSDPVNLYFANSGPFMADSNIPSNFTGVATSAATIDLSWQDNSNIETGFEIWRRKPGGIFELAGKTGANVTTFQDTKLEPSIAYQYKVRAFHGTGRTKYSPGDNVNTNLVITTDADPIAPTAPSNLVVTDNTTSTISLSWTAATDNTGIRRYHVNYGANTVFTPSAATTFTITGLPMNAAYDISVIAEDFGGNLSPASNSVVGSTYVTGLAYGHATGAWTDLDLITNWNAPEFTGHVPNFTLAPRTQEDFFYFEFTGFLYINTGGSYQFRTTSDDGSRVTLDNVVRVNNDGVHNGDVTVTSGTFSLSAGTHTINVRYFEYIGSQSLTVLYRGPDTGNTWVEIPDEALKSGGAPPVPVNAASAGDVLIVSQPEVQPFKVNVYPNPARADNIFVRLEPETDAPVEIQMLDLVGKSFYSKTFEADEVRQGVAIQPANRVIPGIYVLVANQGRIIGKEKVIVRE